MNGNGDNAPKHLDRAFGLVMREKGKLQAPRRKSRILLPDGVQTENLPRALCPVCSKVYDFAVVSIDTLPAHRLCPDCKRLLRDGWTVFVSAGKPPLAVKSEILKSEGLAGKIAPVSAEDYAKLALKKDPADALPESPSAQ